MEAHDQDRLRKFYDQFGAKQDDQGFYEDAAIAVLVREGRFETARSVLEVGCGTGKLAAQLLTSELPANTRYVGIDISTTMVALARERLMPFGKKAQVHRSGGDLNFGQYGNAFDRVVFAYVLDLLSVAQIHEALANAHAVLRTGGLLCIAGLTEGNGPLSRLASNSWAMIHRINPYLVGGCRPLLVSEYIDDDRWRIVKREVIVSALIPSEVVVAEAI